jgi:hypothetical protein
MAVLTTQQIDDVLGVFMRGGPVTIHVGNSSFTVQLNAQLDGGGTLLKSQNRDAIVAIDGAVDDNATTLNNAIPQPQRSALSTKAKALMLALVAFRRAMVA